MTTIKNLALSILTATATLQATATAQFSLFDDFEDGALDSTLWETILPFAGSSVTEAQGEVEFRKRAWLLPSSTLGDAGEEFTINLRARVPSDMFWVCLFSTDVPGGCCQYPTESLVCGLESFGSAPKWYVQVRGPHVDLTGDADNHIEQPLFGGPVHDWKIVVSGGVIRFELTDPSTGQSAAIETPFTLSGQEPRRLAILNRELTSSVSWLQQIQIGPNDCNGNGNSDADDISAGTSTDCDGNGTPDECDIANGLDCNGNGIPDSCDIASGSALDCNNNGFPDACDIANDPTVDANLNSIPDSCEVAGSRYWILSPVTGNWYAVTDELDVYAADQVASNWGGDLVTIDDQAENDWLQSQFGDADTPIWIGLTDVNVEGSFEWLSGAPVTYTNWRAGEPSNTPGNLGGADFVILHPPTGTWMDEDSTGSTFAPGLPRGVVELASSDCDGNGIPDAYELLIDTSLDCDGNGVHDLCDLQDPALDCDSDGVLDSCQIAADPSLDCDGNGAIDSCEILADTSLDCDADQTLDVCQITADPSLDWNGDGLLDSCAGGGFVYCDSNLNAAGLVGALEPQGSPLIADDSFTLYGYDLPLTQPAMVIMSRSTNYVNPFGGGAGVLCLGAPIRRFNLAAGFPLQFTSSNGDFSLTPPIGQFPGPNAVLPGEVIHFQLWHREFDPATGTPRSNTTDGISVMFR